MAEQEGSAARDREQSMSFGPVDADLVKPSMGDQRVVEAMVREMLTELVAIRKKYNEGGDATEAQAKATELAHKWAPKFDAANDAFEQTMTAEGQHDFIHGQGYGEGPDDAVLGLVADTLLRVTTAMAGAEDDKLDAEQLKFELDAAVEDCTYFVMGLTNGVE